MKKAILTKHDIQVEEKHKKLPLSKDQNYLIVFWIDQSKNDFQPLSNKALDWQTFQNGLSHRML